MNNERITIKDVAKACGCSAQTVSRVFSGKGYVSKDTKEFVMKKAAEMNFIINKQAILFKKGKTNKIYVVFDTLKNLYFSIIIELLNNEIKKHSYYLETLFVECHTLTKEIYYDLVSNNADAVISLLEVDDEVTSLIDKFHLPIVIVGRTNNSNKISWFSSDDIYGGEVAAKYLTNKGCKSFIYYGETKGLICSIEREEGFNNKLKEFGYVSKSFFVEDNDNGLFDYLERNRIDGVFCFCDMLAYEFKKTCKVKLNYKPLIIGYDALHNELPVLSNIPSISVDKELVIKEAVDAIIDIIEGKKLDGIHKKFSPKLYPLKLNEINNFKNK